MIRTLDANGRLQDFDGWDRLAASAESKEGLLDIQVLLPDSIDLPPERLRTLNKILRPGGLLRIQGLQPHAPAPGRYSGPVANRADALIRDAGKCGFTFIASEPACIRQHEFLARYLGLTDELIGRRRLLDAEFAEFRFRKTVPAGRERIRLGIITQDLYYAFMYESPALAAHFEIMKMEYRPFSGPDAYQPLLDFKPEVLLVYRPDYLAPEVFEAFDCPTIGFASEPLPRRENGRLIASDYNRQAYDLLKRVKGCCDYLYHYDQACLDFLREEGFPTAGLFPPCVCTDVYRPDPTLPKRWDAVFIGKSTPHREDLLFSLHLTCNFFHGAHGLTGAEETLPFLQRALIGLNLHRDETPNLEPRLIILMACGLFVLTETLRPNPWFREGEHYVAFDTKADMVDKVRYYLEHDDEREAIAANGLDWARTQASSLVVLPRLVKSVLET